MLLKHRFAFPSLTILCLTVSSFLSACGLRVRPLRLPSETTIQLTGSCHTGEGDGSLQSPIPLFDANDWLSLETQPTDDIHFILCSDIDFTGVAYSPITVFEGVLNGNSKTLSNLTYDNQDPSFAAQKQGLFRTLDGAMIHDLTLESFTLNSEARYLGALAGESLNGSLIQRVAIRNAVLTGFQQIGAFFGTQVNSRVENSAATGIDIEVDSTDYVYSGIYAGMIYRNDGELTIDCENIFSSGTLRTRNSGRYFGGYAGMGFGISTKNITVHIDFPTTQSNGYVGGVFGYVDTSNGDLNTHENIVLTGSFSIATGGGRIGGFVGHFQGTKTMTLRNVFIDLPISHANASKGAIVGYLMTSWVSLENAFWTMNSLAQSAPGAITTDGISGQYSDADFYEGGILSDPSTHAEWKDPSIWRLFPSAYPRLTVREMLE